MQMITYQEYVEPYLNNFKQVFIEEEQLNRIQDFVVKLIDKKNTEQHHQIDNNQEKKRWTTGFCGEAALEKYLGVKYIDYSIGDSSEYHIADLSKIGLRIGVKTVEYGKFPIIFKNSFKSEVIILKRTDIEYLVCGIATKEILNRYQSDSLILSPALRARGTKTGFYGFQHLAMFHSVQELKNY
jgi:hypothetical protein